MSTKYQFLSPCGIYYISFAVVDWIDVFTRNVYKDIVVESLKYCCDFKGMRLFAWCSMTNQVHLIFGVKVDFKHSDLIRDFKKFTSKAIINAIIHNTQESRKEWMLEKFLNTGSNKTNISGYQFWQHDNHPIEVFTPTVIAQKLDYIHLNPVQEGIVKKAHHYIYSSPSNYKSGKGMINDEIFDFPIIMIGYI